MADTLNQTIIYNNQVEILSTANRGNKTFQVGELVYDSQEEALYIGDLENTQGGILLTNANNLAVNKLDISGGTLSGQLNMSNNAILNVPDPSEPKDAANKRYIDTAVNNLKFGLNLTINDLNDVDPALAPVDGDVLVYDGTTNRFIVRPQSEVDNQSLSWDGTTLAISEGNSVDINSFTQTVDFATVTMQVANISQANISQLNYFGPFGTLQADIKGDVYGLDSSLIIDAENGNITGKLTGDVTGSVFADDSTLLVDSVNGKLVGDYENGSSVINNTSVTSYDLVALQDANINDLYVSNKIYGGATGSIKNVQIASTAPSNSTGATGDRAGMIAFDSSYIYYCTTTYTDGVANIWKRVTWSGDTW